MKKKLSHLFEICSFIKYSLLSKSNAISLILSSQIQKSVHCFLNATKYDSTILEVMLAPTNRPTVVFHTKTQSFQSDATPGMRGCSVRVDTNIDGAGVRNEHRTGGQDPKL